jgi:hypothetical protein
LVFAVKDEVSMTVDGEDSGGVIERAVSVCYPHDGLFRNFVIVIPYSDVAAARVSWAEKPKHESFSFRNQYVTIFDGLVRGNGVKGNAESENE